MLLGIILLSGYVLGVIGNQALLIVIDWKAWYNLIVALGNMMIGLGLGYDAYQEAKSLN